MKRKKSSKFFKSLILVCSCMMLLKTNQHGVMLRHALKNHVLILMSSYLKCKLVHKVCNLPFTSLYLAARRLAMVFFPHPVVPINIIRGVWGATLRCCALMKVIVYGIIKYIFTIHKLVSLFIHYPYNCKYSDLLKSIRFWATRFSF